MTALRAGLKPDEFWSMTPAEVLEVIEADAWRYDRWGRTLATFVASLINTRPGMKKRVRPRDLWRSRFTTGAAAVSREERQRQFEAAVRLMGPQAIPVRIQTGTQQKGG